MRICGHQWRGYDYHECVAKPDHDGPHRCACGAKGHNSGTPALTPGVLEDGGSVPVGESSPPAPDAPMADPPSPPPRAAAGMTAAEANRMLDDLWRAHLAQHQSAEMRVERCRALLEQWRKDRLDYPKETPHGYAAYVAVKACEDELREALGDES